MIASRSQTETLRAHLQDMLVKGYPEEEAVLGYELDKMGGYQKNVVSHAVSEFLN